MASDLIRKADVQKILKALYDNRQYSDVTSTLFVAMENIHDLPTVDAVEVVHGEWEEDGLYYNCSRCSCSAVFTTYANLVFNYCPYCGATMDGGKKEWI